MRGGPAAGRSARASDEHGPEETCPCRRRTRRRRRRVDTKCVRRAGEAGEGETTMAPRPPGSLSRQRMDGRKSITSTRYIPGPRCITREAGTESGAADVGPLCLNHLVFSVPYLRLLYLLEGVCSSVCASVCASVHPSVRPSVRPFVRPSVRPSTTKIQGEETTEPIEAPV